MKLSKCKCGKDVEIKYRAGIAPSLAVKVGMTISKPYPRYYIECSCGQCAEVRVTATTEQQRDKQKRLLIKSWNDRQTKIE